MKIIPLQAVPSQTVQVSLAGQSCKINVYQLDSGLYCDLFVNNVMILGGIICQDRNRIVRDAYFGFVGDLGFIDTQGTQDPDYTGLGSRYNLAYLETTDLNGAF